MKKRVLPIMTFALLFFWTSLVMAETYQLSMLPRYSSEEILKRISPLANHLSGSAKVEPYLTSNFDQYLKGLQSGTIEVGYQNPYIYTLASNEHEVIGMAVKGESGDKFRGIIIVRAGSQIGSVDELKGKRVSFVGPTSAGGFLSQKLSLMQAGLDVEKDLELIEAVENKQENVIFAVYSGDADAGFIRESALGRVQKFVPPSAITVIKRTAWLPNWALSVKRSLPKQFKNLMRQKLSKLQKGHPVLKALKVDSLRPADDSEYNPVRQAAGLPVPELQ